MPNTCDYYDDQIVFVHTYSPHPRDSDFIMHVHEECELFYFISGNAKFLVEGSEYPLKPGYLLLMSPVESHRIKILADEPYERFTVQFSPSLFDSLDPSRRLLSCFQDRPLGKQNLYLPTEFGSSQPIEFLHAMHKPIPDREAKRLAVYISFLSLLHLLNQAFEKKQQSETDTAARDIAEEVVGYINQHLFDDLSLELLGRQFYMSTSQLSRLFKRATGSPVWEYIQIKRLMAARSQIRSNVPVSKAAADCGFHDYSAFYRAYLHKFGVSPKKDKENTAAFLK